jgi:hypothetical protein
MLENGQTTLAPLRKLIKSHCNPDD